VDSKFEAFLKPIEKLVLKVSDVVGGTLGWVVFKGSRLIKVAEEWEASDVVKDVGWTIVKFGLLFNGWILPSVLAVCVSGGTALDVMFIVKIATIFGRAAWTAHEQNSDIGDELLVKQTLKMLVSMGVAYCLEKGCLWITWKVSILNVYHKLPLKVKDVIDDITAPLYMKRPYDEGFNGQRAFMALGYGIPTKNLLSREIAEAVVDWLWDTVKKSFESDRAKKIFGWGFFGWWNGQTRKSEEESVRRKEKVIQWRAAAARWHEQQEHQGRVVA
jgi:hypothetical protein